MGTLILMLPLLFWLHPSSWHSVALPGGAVLNRSPLACDRVSLLFPKKNNKKQVIFTTGDIYRPESNSSICVQFRRNCSKLKAWGYLDLRELACVVLHGADDLVT